ncbi:MAG: hypothetical protein ACFFD2_09385 [Promethearchaeota archaeon]
MAAQRNWLVCAGSLHIFCWTLFGTTFACRTVSTDCKPERRCPPGV